MRPGTDPTALIARIPAVEIAIVNLLTCMAVFILTSKGAKCRHQFCYDCGANHLDIITGDNSAHKRTCRLHPDNLKE